MTIQMEIEDNKLELLKSLTHIQKESEIIYHLIDMYLDKNEIIQTINEKKKRKFGIAKEWATISNDFFEPLEMFKEYR